MANVIATKDPSASRRVVLSAHFDSKFFPSYPNSQVRCYLEGLVLCITSQPGSSLVLLIQQCPVR